MPPTATSSSTNTPDTPQLSSTNPLDLIATFRIWGLALNPQGEATSLVVPRCISFPSPSLYCDTKDEPIVQNLLPHPIPTVGIELEVRISSATSLQLGHGRASFTYPLEVLAVKEAVNTMDGEEVIASDSSSLFCFDMDSRRITMSDGRKFVLPPLCMKLAQPCFTRSLAREAWFYEQLTQAGHTGVTVPRSFGLFHIGLGPSPVLQLTLPSYNLIEQENYDDFGGSAALPDDSRDETTFRGLDRPTYVESPWYSFEQELGSPNVTIMILEQGGPHITRAESIADRQELKEIYYELCSSFFLHCDMRFPNVIRAPAGTTTCPKHKYVHKWVFIDWEDALILDNEDAVATRLKEVYAFQEDGPIREGVALFEH